MHFLAFRFLRKLMAVLFVMPLQDWSLKFYHEPNFESQPQMQQSTTLVTGKMRYSSINVTEFDGFVLLKYHPSHTVRKWFGTNAWSLLIILHFVVEVYQSFALHFYPVDRQQYSVSSIVSNSSRIFTSSILHVESRFLSIVFPVTLFFTIWLRQNSCWQFCGFLFEG